jgi:hypothetical protein
MGLAKICPRPRGSSRFCDANCNRNVFQVVISGVMKYVMAAISSARPDYLAHERAIRATFPEVVSLLRETLGAKLCAYLGSVKETRAVNEWADGIREPSDATQQRLRFALQVALAIAGADGPEVTRAWFQGLNPQLDDRSPARVLREGDLQEVGPAVVAAERAFLVGG